MINITRSCNLWSRFPKLQNRRMYSNAGNGCWKCNGTHIKNTFFCASCGVLRDTPVKEDFFKLLKVAKQFNVDLTQLTQNFRQIQSVIHPDKFGKSESKEKALALEWSSLVNKAYKTLSKSIDRGKYLLELKGIAISEANSSVDQEFLLEMMDVNESVDEAETTQELKQLASEMAAKFEQLNGQLDHSFNNNDMDVAKQVIVRLNYVLNIETAIKEKTLRLQLKT